MNKFLAGLTIASVIGVGVLFYLFFSNKNCKPAAVVQTADGKQVTKDFRIAYLEMDSIENNFQYFKTVRNSIRDKEQQIAKQLTPDRDAYVRKMQELQANGQNLSPEQQQAAVAELQKMEERYKNKESMLASDMQEESFKKLQDVKKKIEDYLKEYNQDKNYAFIVANTSDLFYYRDTVYNITGDVLKGLNDKYKSTKK